jgi:hypothetical protein
MYTNDRKRGAALGLSVVLAFFLLALLLGLFWISMYMGGEREAKTAGDSGALNVGKQTSTTVQVPLQGDEIANFTDVSNSGQIGLTNINRVWAKALLVAINGAQMQSDGSIGSGQSDVKSMQHYADAVSQRLAQQLSDPTNLTNFYLQYADQNSTRMLGNGSSVQVDDGLIMNWSTSFLDCPADGNPAGTPYESNVFIDTSNNVQLPPGYDASSLQTITPKKDPTHTYLAGYVPYSVMNLNFWQVPFRFGERPHLVAKSEFQQFNDPTKLGPPGWSPNAVPNSFSTLGGTVNNRQYGLQAAAWVQANPQKSFQAAIPDGYVRILIHQNKLVWTLVGAFIPGYLTETDSYDFYPAQYVTPDFSTVSVLVCATATPQGLVGNEYAVPTVFTGLYATPPIPPMSCQSFSELLARVNQIHPGTSSGALIGLLSSMPLNPTGGDQEFAIYNVNPTDYTSQLLITPLSASPPTVQGLPDGSQQSMESEGPMLGPDFCWMDITCDTSPFVPGLATISATRTWTPGTGYNSTPGQGACLGKLEVQRETDLDFIVPPCACDL